MSRYCSGITGGRELVVYSKLITCLLTWSTISARRKHPTPTGYLGPNRCPTLCRLHPINNMSDNSADDTTSTFTLPDGRKLGYAQFGAPTGRPVIVLHGLAGSRLEGAFYHDLGVELNARIIGIDRPGMGLSTHQAKRTVLGFAADVGHLTEHLALKEYAIMGISGGGPVTLACAKALPADKLRAAAMVVALGPPDIGMTGAQLVNRIGYPHGYRYCPSFLNRWFWRRQPWGRVDLSDEERLAIVKQQTEKTKASANPRELAAMTDEPFLRIALRNTRQGFVQGYDGVLVDGGLSCMDFGFKVEDIRPNLPIHLWYGKHDVLVPPIQGVVLAKRLGDRATLHLEDETHVSMTYHRRREILEQLLKAM
ncbi:hypothetical protein ANO11243_084520 [Dothideomycetidae sp. 11243]|nr:hypothetical protein ANO11243_084520 [fungal sp. No.11243]